MAQSNAQSAVEVPRWLIILGSIAIVFHLTGVVFGALMAPGPFSMAEGDALPAPQFARAVDTVTRPLYLNPIKFTHNYHFLTNAPSGPGIEFEVHLKDRAGERLKDAEGHDLILHFPDKNANVWVRQRQALLARNLGNDIPVAPPLSEQIAAPDTPVEKVQIWEESNRQLQLKLVERHLVPRDQMVLQPSDWSMLVARSYVRHLCRMHGAASGALVRIHQDPIPPVVLSMDSVQSGAFDKVASNFGEFKGDDADDVRSNRPRRR